MIFDETRLKILFKELEFYSREEYFDLFEIIKNNTNLDNKILKLIVVDNNIILEAR